MNIGIYLGAVAFPIAVCAMILALRISQKLEAIERRPLGK
jgi:hypothetical protein